MATVKESVISLLVPRKSYDRPLKAAALFLAASGRKSFETATSPEGVPWKPLKNPSKRRGGVTSRPLRDKGFLMASQTGAGSVSRTGVAITWGSSLPYAKYHQQGTKTIPARPFVGLTKAMLERLRQIIDSYPPGA